MSVEGVRDRVLILGGGDGLALREVLKYDAVKKIDLVDIDPRIIELGKDFSILRKLNKNSLNDPRVTVFTEDAFSFLNQYGPKYDRVIIDFPDPHNEALSKLYSKEFYNIVRKRMNEGGAMVTQSSSPFFTRRAFWCINSTIESVFGHTLAYNIALPSFGIWGFNLSTYGTSIPDSWNIAVPTKAIRSSTMAKAIVFDSDISRVDTPVNSLFLPKLYQFYAEDIQS
jgi:spermidine synthase